MKLNLNCIRSEFTAWISQEEKKGIFDHKQATKLAKKFQEIFSKNKPKKFPDCAQNLVAWAEKKRKKKHFFSKEDIRRIDTEIQTLITKEKSKDSASSVSEVVPPVHQLTEESLQKHKLKIFVQQQEEYSEKTIFTLSQLEEYFSERMQSATNEDFFFSFLPGHDEVGQRRAVLLNVEKTFEPILPTYDTVHNKTVPQLEHDYPRIHDASFLKKAVESLQGQADRVHQAAHVLEEHIRRVRQRLFPEKSVPKPEEVPVHEQPASPLRDIVNRYNLEEMEKGVSPGAEHPSPALANLIKKIKVAVQENAPERIFDLAVMPREQNEFEKNVRAVRLVCHPDKNLNNSVQALGLFKLCQEVNELLMKMHYHQ